MSESLESLRLAIEKDQTIKQYDDKLIINEVGWDLKTPNVFKTHDLNTIYFYWTHKDTSVAEYIKACEDSHVGVVPFIDRSELLEILTGAKSATTTTTTTSQGEQEINNNKRKAEDDLLIKEIKANEIDLIDHNKALRGSKLIDFSQIKRECEQKIIKPILSKKSKSSNNNNSSSGNGIGLSVTLKNKDPIILMSPSASALLNMSNIKDFLSTGVFNQTHGLNNGDNFIKIKHNSSQFNKSINFLVINNIDKFIVKPEYWDRVVAIFTTGQEWQFKNYKFKEPNVLFQKFKGYYVGWESDPLPPNISKWNVEIIKMERNVRFKDGQVSQHLWESLERWMGSRGYK